MLAILIIAGLVVALVVVMGSRGDAEVERDDLRRELEGRKYAEEAGKPYDPDKPCGHSSCNYPICSFHPAGSPPVSHPQDQGCYLNDGLNYYEDDDEAGSGSNEIVTREEVLRQTEELVDEFNKGNPKKRISDSWKSL